MFWWLIGGAASWLLCGACIVVFLIGKAIFADEDFGPLYLAAGLSVCGTGMLFKAVGVL